LFNVKSVEGSIEEANKKKNIQLTEFESDAKKHFFENCVKTVVYIFSDSLYNIHKLVKRGVSFLAVKY
jgi:hypothetical protein